MRNNTLTSQQYDLKDLFDTQFRERLEALSHELHEAGIPHLFYTQVVATDSAVGAKINASYGEDQKESGYVHDLLVDVATSQGPSGMRYTLEQGLKAIDQLEAGDDLNVHEDPVERAAAGGDFMARLMLSMRERHNRQDTPDIIDGEVVEEQPKEDDDDDDPGIDASDLIGMLMGGMGGRNSNPLAALMSGLGGGGDDDDGHDVEGENCAECPIRDVCPLRHM